MIALDNGFQEVVGLVADCHASTARLCRATGFAMLYSGQVAPGALALLGLPAGQRAREVLIGHPAVARGRIRLISLAGASAGVMRDGAQAWDSGGIFDINLRALPKIEPLHHRLTLEGFVGFAPITAWDFGTLAVRQVLSRDGDGLCLALMERVSPPLTGYEGLSGPASWVFNSTQVVADFATAQAFYRDNLGWKVVQESAWSHAGGGNCMGLPVRLAPDIELRAGIYQANGAMAGSVEVIAFSCGGLDFSGAAPPARGWAALRFAVSDLSAFLASGAAGGARCLGPLELDWQPYGACRAGAVITSWGVRLEAFEPNF